MPKTKTIEDDNVIFTGRMRFKGGVNSGVDGLLVGRTYNVSIIKRRNDRWVKTKLMLIPYSSGAALLKDWTFAD